MMSVAVPESMADAVLVDKVVEPIFSNHLMFWYSSAGATLRSLFVTLRLFLLQSSVRHFTILRHSHLRKFRPMMLVRGNCQDMPCDAHAFELLFQLSLRTPPHPSPHPSPCPVAEGDTKAADAAPVLVIDVRTLRLPTFIHSATLPPAVLVSALQHLLLSFAAHHGYRRVSFLFPPSISLHTPHSPAAAAAAAAELTL